MRICETFRRPEICVEIIEEKLSDGSKVYSLRVTPLSPNAVPASIEGEPITYEFEESGHAWGAFFALERATDISVGF